MIKLLVMDVDGTLTDGRIYMGNSGEVMKSFNIKDGYGIHDILIPKGILPVIITGRKSKILENRCAELGITELYQGVNDKIQVLKKIVADREVEFCDIAYIGDDLNDLTCMQEIKKRNGLVGSPSDAVVEIRNIADFISNFKGGEGAVREFIEWIVKI